MVPASDGAGEVMEVGKHVHRFKKGDQVLTLFNQGHLAGSIDDYSITTGVGGTIDGTLQQYGAYDEQGLVHKPTNLNYLEGSTLTCAGLTAWNALYGLDGRALMPGDWVLTQGTGGVSMFALQFAKAAGARVISTTSSKEKANKLKELGADHIINYKEDENWGESAKKLTGGRGVQHVVEVGGPNTLKQSLKAIAFDGVISIIGFLGGVKGESQPTFLDCLMNICTVRGVYVGSRMQFEAMNRAIEANGIKPVVDEKVFKLEEARDAVSPPMADSTDNTFADHFTLLFSTNTCGIRSTSASSASALSRYSIEATLSFIIYRTASRRKASTMKHSHATQLTSTLFREGTV